VSRFGKVRDKASPFDPSLRDYWEDRRSRRARGQGKPETFAFLSFIHIFGRTREGRRLIWRHTVREPLNVKLRQVKATLLAGLLAVFLVTLAGGDPHYADVSDDVGGMFLALRCLRHRCGAPRAFR